MKQAIRGALLLMLGVIGCGSAQETAGNLPPPPEDPPPELQVPNPTAVSDGFLLDDKQLAESREKANRGDAEAAFRLSLHYMTLKQPSQTNYWSLLASARGQSSAQYNRWFDLKDAVDCKSKIEGLAWLKASSFSGDELSVNELKKYEPTVQPCFEK